MTGTATIGFRKMNGLGNDFVVIDARSRALGLGSDVVRAIADRKEGIGCDQIIALEPSRKADVFMRIWNADGGEVGACGNAARCVAALVAAERGEPKISIETESAVLGATVNGDGSVTVDMGSPRFVWDEIPLSEPFHDTRRIELQVGPIDAPVLHTPSVVNVGNPHCLFFVDDVVAYDLARFGPMLEHHPLFPERANISLVQVTGPDALIVRTWERGAGLTRACGTAACAAAVAAARRELVGRKVRVSLPGGDLNIEWRESDGHILMTGPYALDFEGTLPAALFRPAGV
ncbi:MAG TPA: diaminopimelate epimerase [Rhizobiales bacterium]|jgi:diaminopimelate epimerase|nr:diaminopimelate epimerase [Hyphomicrobiales bacterium]HBR25741.1 diaminopimelate epimerase [Hyphomicrobiales bacterium]